MSIRNRIRRKIFFPLVLLTSILAIGDVSGAGPCKCCKSGYTTRIDGARNLLRPPIKTELGGYGERRTGSRTKRTKISSTGEDQVIINLRLAIAELQRRDEDPDSAGLVSYAQIAAIHGYPESIAHHVNSTFLLGPEDVVASVWNKCPHGEDRAASTGDDDADLFLVWHRAYIIAFEATVQSVLKTLGVPNAELFRLPYWEWEKSSAVPPAFLDVNVQDTETCNSLFSSERSAAARAGEYMLDTKEYSDPLSIAAFGGFDRFSNEFRAIWHGLIHLNVGGDAASGGEKWMSSSSTAAFDPLFWVHHSNVDRLFQIWLNRYHREQNISFDKDLDRLRASWNKAIGAETSGGDKYAFLVEIDGKPFWWRPSFDELGIRTTRGRPRLPTVVGARWNAYGRTSLKYSAIASRNEDALLLPISDKILRVDENSEMAFADCSDNGSKTIVRTKNFIVRRDGAIATFKLTKFEVDNIRLWARGKADSEYTSVYLEFLDAEKFDAYSIPNLYNVLIRHEGNAYPKYKNSYVGSISSFDIPFYTNDRNAMTRMSRRISLPTFVVDNLPSIVGGVFSLDIQFDPVFSDVIARGNSQEEDELLSVGEVRLVVRRAGMGQNNHPWWCFSRTRPQE